MAEPVSEELKKWLAQASYQDMLQAWRYAPVGDPRFMGSNGDYFAEAIKRKREEVGQGAAVTASKAIGWNGATPLNPEDSDG